MFHNISPSRGLPPGRILRTKLMSYTIVDLTSFKKYACGWVGGRGNSMKDTEGGGISMKDTVLDFLSAYLCCPCIFNYNISKKVQERGRVAR